MMKYLIIIQPNRLHVMISGVMQSAVPILILNKDSETSKINKILNDNQLSELIIEQSDNAIKIEESYIKQVLTIRNIASKNKKLSSDKIKRIFQK